MKNVPTAGVTVQLIARLSVPLRVAVMASDPPELSEAVAGVTAIETGISESTALALLPGDA